MGQEVTVGVQVKQESGAQDHMKFHEKKFGRLRRPWLVFCCGSHQRVVVQE